MNYRVMPFGEIWKYGIFNIPISIIDNYVKMASEYQLKALLYILRHGGQASSSQIAKALGCAVSDIDNILEFWIQEGVLASDGENISQSTVKTQQQADSVPEKKEPEKAKKELLSPPSLTPADIVRFSNDDKDIAFLMTEAQKVLGRTISHSEQEMITNMVYYYGLKVEVVLTILEFYRLEKAKGRTIGVSYINTMARNWADEGIDNVTAADTKLKEIEKSDRLWMEVAAITGISHKRPTQNQRSTVCKWFENFDITMITIAAEIMKEHTAKPSLKYIDSILEKWKKNDITSPAQVKAYQEEFEKSKSKGKKSDEKLKSKPSYNLEKIKQEAMDNTEI